MEDNRSRHTKRRGHGSGAPRGRGQRTWAALIVIVIALGGAGGAASLAGDGADAGSSIGAENTSSALSTSSSAGTTSGIAESDAGVPAGADGNKAFDLAQIPWYTGNPWFAVNDNAPTFTAEEINSTPHGYESYSPLDSLGRCGVAFALVGPETMPRDGEERGRISSVKPTGWHQGRYSFVDGEMLYNRCHLLGWQLTAENANYMNLITGTRYLNIEGMLPFEEDIAHYVDRTGNHVLYCVTPVFYEDEAVARGVHMEGYSVEDKGHGISFNAFCYNVQPGVAIDYATGNNWEDSAPAAL